MHYRTVTVNSPISGQNEAQEIADELVSNVQTLYLFLLPNVITFKEVNVIGLTDPTVQAIAVGGNAGTDPANPVSLRSAPVVKLGTGLRGRSFNGRMYLMTPSESEQNAGAMAGQYVTDLDTFVNGIRRISQQPSTNVYDGTIYSRTLTGQGPIVDNLITTIVVNPFLGSLRSRQDV